MIILVTVDIARCSAPVRVLFDSDLIVHLSNSLQHGARFVELDILGAILREDLFGVRGKLEQSRLRECRFIFVPKVLEARRARAVYRSDAMIARGDHTYWTCS